MRDEDEQRGLDATKAPVGGSADNSNTQFAMLALHEAERAGVKESRTRPGSSRLNYWTQPGMQSPGGGYGYGINQHDTTGSMTCAAIASLIMARDRSAARRTPRSSMARCSAAACKRPTIRSKTPWTGWASIFRSIAIRNHRVGGWLLYYLYALERVGRMSGQRVIS